MTEAIGAGIGGMSIAFVLREKSIILPFGSAGKRSGGASKVSALLGRTQTERRRRLSDRS
jgi:predicted NAD/FAD-binding protein